VHRHADRAQAYCDNVRTLRRTLQGPTKLDMPLSHEAEARMLAPLAEFKGAVRAGAGVELDAAALGHVRAGFLDAVAALASYRAPLASDLSSSQPTNNRSAPSVSDSGGQPREGEQLGDPRDERGKGFLEAAREWHALLCVFQPPLVGCDAIDLRFVAMVVDALCGD
jgi:hypothetical protein